ncbi:MAG TPA: LemA family protein [Candidatus Stercoripulliclostridium merdipullorum]|uniref:LemA family protein n=1 Tax=Candidatus Stercoripulliclostridium merdipullorum TaxID=2840952 RepID=A0A9D1ND52_9FIRM|nr:LemA family protein [Candidatus Stercoripulliclostridium merdipullorum]
MMCIITTIVIYNKLVKLNNRVENSWAQIDVQLKKRYDLVPNLVETVKGYATHEKEVLTEVTKARASVGSARTPEESIEANNTLSGALSRLLVVAERYPNLQANANFLDLQATLKDLEHKIAMSRQFYNDSVMNYNQKRELFPSNIVAKIFRFKEAAYFEAGEEVKEAPKVQF